MKHTILTIVFLVVGAYARQAGIVGNLTEPTWLAGKTDTPQTGEVVLLADGRPVARLSTDTPRFADAEFAFTMPILDAQEITLRLSAFQRADFGEIYHLMVRGDP